MSKENNTPDIDRCPKVTYRSRKIAAEIAKQSMGMRAYRCGTCRLWHLTSSPKRRNNKSRGFLCYSHSYADTSGK